MNSTYLAQLITIVSTMRSNEPWTSAHDEAYYLGLSDLPDRIATDLRRLILLRFEWRPSVKQIRELASEILNPIVSRNAADVVSELYQLRRRYGAYAVFDPELPGVLKRGEPNWSDPVKRKVIESVGGWVNFCEDASAPGVMRGQLLKIAELVLRDTQVTERRLRELIQTDSADSGWKRISE